MLQSLLSRRAGLLAAGFGIAGLLLSSAPASAQDAWKIGSAAQPGSTLVEFLETFVANVNQAAAGKLVTERQFVASEQELINQVVRGRLPMAGVSFGGSTVVIPELSVLNIPYLWASIAERDWVMEKHGVEIARKLYAEKNLVLLSVFDIGFNGVLCKIDCRQPASLKGVKARVGPMVASRVFWRQMEANGVQMALSDLFPALQQGVVEAADLPFSYYVTTPAAQTNPVFVNTLHLHGHGAFVVNRAAFEQLPAEVQRALRAAPPTLAFTYEANLAREATLIARFRAAGGTFHELSDAARLDWQKLLVPAQLDVVKDIGGRAQEVYDAILKGKAEYAAQKGKS